jgi:hypothetical protein
MFQCRFGPPCGFTYTVPLRKGRRSASCSPLRESCLRHACLGVPQFQCASQHIMGQHAGRSAICRQSARHLRRSRCTGTCARSVDVLVNDARPVVTCSMTRETCAGRKMHARARKKRSLKPTRGDQTGPTARNVESPDAHHASGSCRARVGARGRAAAPPGLSAHVSQCTSARSLCAACRPRCKGERSRKEDAQGGHGRRWPWRARCGRLAGEARQSGRLIEFGGGSGELPRSARSRMRKRLDRWCGPASSDRCGSPACTEGENESAWNARGLSGENSRSVDVGESGRKKARDPRWGRRAGPTRGRPGPGRGDHRAAGRGGQVCGCRTLSHNSSELPVALRRSFPSFAPYARRARRRRPPPPRAQHF